jgi:glucokinase
VVSLIHAYDPELVILGGGVMRSVETILPAVKEFVHEHAHSPWGKVRVVASLLGDTAALVAGEWLVEEQLRYYS